MANRKNKEANDKSEENSLRQNASNDRGQRTARNDNDQPDEKKEIDVEKINKINQSRKGYYSRNGHGGYRGL